MSHVADPMVIATKLGNEDAVRILPTRPSAGVSLGLRIRTPHLYLMLVIYFGHVLSKWKETTFGAGPFHAQKQKKRDVMDGPQLGPPVVPF